MTILTTRCMQRFVLLSAVLLAVSPVAAQDGERKPNLDDVEPFARIWYPATLQYDSMMFMASVAKEAEIDTPFGMMAAMQDRFKKQYEGLEGVRAGVMFVMLDTESEPNAIQTTPFSNIGVPSSKAISFMKVADQAEFEKRVRAQIQMFGPLGKLTGSGDRFTFEMTFPMVITSGGDGNSGSRTMKRHFRFANGMLFEADFEELFDLRLPNADALRIGQRFEDWDIFLELNVDGIPQPVRKTAWKAIELATQTALQQFDDEDEISYLARRSTGEFQLDLLEALVLETKSVRAGMKFATDVDPIRVHLEVQAREKTNLARHFGELGLVDERLTTLRDQPAALTFAMSWAMPDAARKALAGYFQFGRDRLEQQIGANFEAQVAVEQLFRNFENSLDDGNGDLVVKLARTKNEFAVFGGMKLRDANQTADSLELLLNALPSEGNSGVRTSVDKEGRRYLSFLTEDIPFRVVEESIDRVPGRLHFAVTGSTLWFCLGGKDSIETLQNVIATASKPDGKPRSRPVPFLIDIALYRWLADEETADGFSRLPQMALEGIERQIHEWQMAQMKQAITVAREARDAAVKEDDEASSEVTAAQKAAQEQIRQIYRQMPDFKFEASYLRKLLTERQSDFRVEVNAAKERISVDARIGSGLAKLAVARVLDIQMRWARTMQRQIQPPPRAEPAPAAKQAP